MHIFYQTSFLAKFSWQHASQNLPYKEQQRPIKWRIKLYKYIIGHSQQPKQMLPITYQSQTENCIQRHNEHTTHF